MRAITGLSSTLAVALLAARMVFTGSNTFAFLAWNLALAWTPLLLSTALVRVEGRRPVALPIVVVALAAWLVFFPNAPYVVTDFVHLHQRSSAPLWFDLALLFSFAWAAGVCAVVSLRQVHGLIRNRTGDALAWTFVGATAVLTGFGIYLGRFDRWNSWDVIARPRALLRAVCDVVTDPFGNLRAVGVTLVFGALLLVVYAAAAPRRRRGEASA